MKIKCKKIYTIVLLTFLLTSCGGEYSYNEVIGEPKLDKKFEGIISILEKEGKVITYPLDESSNSITPIAMEKEERLYMVSYLNYKKKLNGENVYGLAFFRKKEEEWFKDRDVEIGGGNGLNRIRVTDLDGDEVCEICVNTYSNSNAMLRIFSFNESFFKDYGLMRVKDFKIDENINDQNKSIVTIENKAEKSEITVRQVLDGRIKIKSSATVGNFENGNRIELGEITENEIGVYVFSASENIKNNLSVLRVKDGIIESVLNKKNLSDILKKEKIVKLKGMYDINGNGKKEVCYISSSKKFDEASLPIFKYLDVTDSENVYLAQRIYSNDRYGFTIKLEKEFGEEILVKSALQRKEPGEHFLFSSISKNAEERLFEITCIEKNSKEARESKDYELGSNSMYSFYLKILNNNLEKDFVKSMFKTK